MPYIPADITRKILRSHGHLRGGLDEGGSASREVEAALKDPHLRIWLDSWVMPGLDALREWIDELDARG